MPRDARAAVRQKISLVLRVKGTDVSGRPFEEDTRANDVSDEGISFHLKAPIWINSYLTVDRISPHGETSEPARALVIRIRTEASGVQWVAARLD